MIGAKNFIRSLIDQQLQKWSNCKILSWDSIKPQKETFQKRIFKSTQRFLFWTILTLWPNSCPIPYTSDGSVLSHSSWGCLANYVRGKIEDPPPSKRIVVETCKLCFSKTMTYFLTVLGVDDGEDMKLLIMRNHPCKSEGRIWKMRMMIFRIQLYL